MKTLSNCLICGNTELNSFLETKDHFLSKEVFMICECSVCKFQFTNPRPEVDELGRYYQSDDYISHSNTKNTLFSHVYQQIRQYTRKRKYEMVAKRSKGNSILDIGCATGELLGYFQAKGWHVLGIEPSENVANYAREQVGIPVENESHLNQIPDSSFDVITLWHVLEHIPNLNEHMQTLFRLLKEDGLLIVAVPNADSPDARKYAAFWAGYDLPRHLYHFTKDTMQRLLTKHHFECTEILPMKFDSYYVSLLSERYLYNKNRWLSAFFSGLQSNCKAKSKNNYSSLIFVAQKIKNSK